MTSKSATKNVGHEYHAGFLPTDPRPPFLHVKIHHTHAVIFQSWKLVVCGSNSGFKMERHHRSFESAAPEIHYQIALDNAGSSDALLTRVCAPGSIDLQNVHSPHAKFHSASETRRILRGEISHVFHQITREIGSHVDVFFIMTDQSSFSYSEGNDLTRRKSCFVFRAHYFLFGTIANG